MMKKALIYSICVVACIYFVYLRANLYFLNDNFKLFYRANVCLQKDIVDETGKVIIRANRFYGVHIYTIKDGKKMTSVECFRFLRNKGAILLGGAGIAFWKNDVKTIVMSDHKIKRLLFFENSVLKDDAALIPCLSRGDEDFGGDPNTLSLVQVASNGWGSDTAILCIVEK